MKIVKDSSKNAVSLRNELEIPRVSVLPVVGENGKLVFYQENVWYWSDAEPPGAWIESGSNVAPAEQIFLSSVSGGTSLVVSGTGPNLSIRGLKGAGGITLSSTPTEVSISHPSSAYGALASAAGPSVIATGTGPNLTVKRLVAGQNVTLTETSTTITVSVPASGSPTITTLPAGADSRTSADLVEIGSGPELVLKGFFGGANVVVANDSPYAGVTSIRVFPINSPPTYTLASVGSGVSVIANTDPSNMTLKSIAGGGFMVVNLVGSTLAVGSTVNFSTSGGSIDFASSTSTAQNFRARTISFPNTTLFSTPSTTITPYIPGSTMTSGRAIVVGGSGERINWTADYFGWGIGENEVSVLAEILSSGANPTEATLVTVSRIGPQPQPFMLRAFECTLLGPPVAYPLGNPVVSPVLLYFPENENDETPTVFMSLVQPTSVGGGNGSSVLAGSPLFTTGSGPGSITFIASDRSIINGTHLGIVNPRLWEVIFDRSIRVSLKF